jgi:carboxymethylenebutenolidase
MRMSEVNTRDLHPQVWKLFDRYIHGLIDRRGFLDSAAKYAVGGMTAVGILEALSPRYAEAQIQVQPNDPRVRTERVEIRSPEGYGMIRGLLARPASANGPLPAVVVIHENRGLTPHVEDVVRRTAVAGFMAIGPDALTSVRGSSGIPQVSPLLNADDEAGGAMQRKLEPPKMMADFVATARYVKACPDSTGRLGAVGFCFGGGMTWQLVTGGAPLKAAAPFYGPAPQNAAALGTTKIAVNAVYAEQDTGITNSRTALETEIRKSGTPYQMTVYPGVGHAFHNDTGARYNADQAQKAWISTIEWFRKYLV